MIYVKELYQYICQNPQIGAAIITACCGIAGIFINIFINIRFRNKDYKKKIRIQMIENYELYYVPLSEKLENLYETIDEIIKEVGSDVDYMFNPPISAKYVYVINQLRNALFELREFMMKEKYKYQDDYQLFICHQQVKRKVNKLWIAIEKSQSISEELSLIVLRNDLEKFSYMIHYSHARVMIDNFFLRLKQCYLIKKYHQKRTNVRNK